MLSEKCGTVCNVEIISPSGLKENIFSVVIEVICFDAGPWKSTLLDGALGKCEVRGFDAGFDASRWKSTLLD